MRHIWWTILLAVWAGAAGAADRLQVQPIDEAGQNPEFAAFRAALLQAVVQRDIEAILAAASPEVHLSFGGGGGREDFRARLIVDPDTLSDEYRYMADEMREDYWAALETVLRLGGQFDDDGRAFAAPYTWTVDLPAAHDPFETFFVIGDGVALRDRPIRFGTVIATLDHDVVTAIEGGEGTDHMHVRLGDGTTGYVHRDDLRSPIDYRARFERGKGGWNMVFFIAGD